MNALSGLIYAADVAGTLKFVAGVSTIGAVTATGASLVAGWCNADLAKIYEDATYSGGKSDYAKYTAQKAEAYRVFPKALTAAIIAATLFTFTPSQNTLYAIAASELGETALKSETGGKAVQAINAWLDRQIAPEGGGGALTPTERAFLEMLAAKPQGRASYALVRRDDALAIAGGLVAQGYVIERRLGYDPGFQITDAGKAYIGGYHG